MNYCIVNNSTGLVKNEINWDGASPVAVPDGYSLVQSSTIANPQFETGPKTDFQKWEEVQAVGFLDVTTGIKLKTTEAAMRWFTSQVTSTALALQLGALDNNSSRVLWDFNDEAQTLTVIQFLPLMLRYAAHCEAIFNEYAP